MNKECAKALLANWSKKVPFRPWFLLYQWSLSLPLALINNATPSHLILNSLVDIENLIILWRAWNNVVKLVDRKEFRQVDRSRFGKGGISHGLSHWQLVSSCMKGRFLWVPTISSPWTLRLHLHKHPRILCFLQPISCLIALEWWITASYRSRLRLGPCHKWLTASPHSTTFVPE